MKRECAEAAFNMIRSDMTIGLSEGRMIEYIIEYLQYTGLDIKVVTSSMNTALICQKHGLTVIPVWMADSVDIAFDECDQLDKALNALKTGQNMKIQNKIIASMAKQYVLLVDKESMVDELSLDQPVMVAVMSEAFSYVRKELTDMGADVKWKQSTEADALYTNHGDIILECKFDGDFKVEELNTKISTLPGVVDTSLFINMATTAIVGDGENVIQINK